MEINDVWRSKEFMEIYSIIKVEMEGRQPVSYANFVGKEYQTVRSRSSIILI